MRRIVVVAVLFLLAAGIAGSALGAEKYRRYVVRGEGISIAVPASWAATEGGVSRAILERLARENPKLAPFVRGLGGPNSPMKFIALDTRVRDAFATNVNVVVVPVPNGITFAQYRQTLLAELRPIVGSTPIEQSVATIHGVAAARFRYRLQLAFGRKITVQTLQYAFLRPGRSVVVTYTTLPKLTSTYAATFKRSAAAIRFAS